VSRPTIYVPVYRSASRKEELNFYQVYVLNVKFTTMPASRTVLLETTAVNSLLYSTKLLLLSAICALMSTTASLADVQNRTTAGDCWNGLCTQNNRSLDQNCAINVDCATSEVCCSNKCVEGFNCLGEACTFDDDCQWDESCCLGSCRKKNACTNLTVMIAIYISASGLLIAVVCPFVYRKLTSAIQPLSSSRSIYLFNNQELHADIPQEPPSHPTLQTLFARGNGNPLTTSSETTDKESRDVNITITSYGSIRMPNQP